MTLLVTYKKFLSAFSYAHVNDAFLEDDGCNMMSNFMEFGSTPLVKVQALKERGNDLFKQKNFHTAAACYDEACKLLGFASATMNNHDVKTLCDIAVTLNLNLAACTLKLSEHEATKDLCSLVVSFFPRYVKALFRRALALMQLKLFVKAQADLENALSIEPKNKDILRELDVVKGCLLLNSNGKRRAEDQCTSNNIKEGKKPIIFLEPGGKNVVEQSYLPSSSVQCPSLSVGYEPGESGDVTSNRIEVSPIIQTPIIQLPISENSQLEVDSKMETQEVSGDKKTLHFSKKGGGHSHLRINMHTYQKLLEGKDVSFCQNFQLSYMTIRILKPTNPEPEENLSTPSMKKKKKKKKKTRRRTKKKKRIAEVVLNEDVASPSPEMKELNVDEFESQSSNLRLLAQIDTSTIISQQTSMILDHNNLFIFSSQQKTRRLFTARRGLIRQKDQKEKSPRHISATLPGKFPRPCDVSVSRRYSLKVQLQRKRKRDPSSIPYIDKPSKKVAARNDSPTSLIYCSSLSFCSSNSVVGVCDSESLTTML